MRFMKQDVNPRVAYFYLLQHWLSITGKCPNFQCMVGINYTMPKPQDSKVDSQLTQMFDETSWKCFHR